MKAALYARVSTDEQAEEGFSISAQVNQLQEYCNKNNIEVYTAYVDEGVSAKFSDENKRPQFNQMIKDAEKNLFNIILVHKYDRFARNVELSQKIKRQLKKANVNVISMSEPIEDSPIGFFQEGILELLAEYYIRNLAAESKKGHIERASQGYHNGSVPYGYKVDHNHPAKMSINEEQANIIRLIYDMYVNKGYGSTKIAITLKKMNLPAACGDNWAHYTVNRILKNVKYAGKISYLDGIYDGKHDPIIDMETFELTQRYIKDRTWKREPRGVNFQKHFLLGLLRCGECKKAFSILSAKSKKNKYGIRNDKKFNYYRCNNYGHLDSVNRCTNNKRYNAEQFEPYIINYLKEIMSELPTEIQIKQKVDIIQILKDRKNKILAELNRAKKAYLAGVFTLEEYTDIKNNLDKELKETNKPTETNREAFKDKIKTILDEFEAAETPPEKRTVLKKIIDVIYIYPDKIEIIFIE